MHNTSNPVPQRSTALADPISHAERDMEAQIFETIGRAVVVTYASSVVHIFAPESSAGPEVSEFYQSMSEVRAHYGALYALLGSESASSL